jgi:ubiquinone/menaquinone biosynthesis C-methylase UbiE
MHRRLMEHHSLQFYDKFAAKFDVMVSGKRFKTEIPFFEKIFKEHNVKSVLDCACGTGKHVIKFAELGYDAVGSDINEEMLKRARINARAAKMNPEFVRADFKELDRVFDRKFDCVFCSDNNAEHELEGIMRSFRSIYDILNPRGVAVIEMRHLPYNIERDKRIFPMHYHKEPNGDRKLFIYVMDFHETTVTINILSFLEFDGESKFEVDSVDYRIVKADEFKRMLSEVGFKELRFYGDHEFTEFKEDLHEQIVAVGIKK